MKFRSCRDKSQAIQFKNDAYIGGTWFPSKVKGLLFCTAVGYQMPLECNMAQSLFISVARGLLAFREL